LEGLNRSKDSGQNPEGWKGGGRGVNLKNKITNPSSELIEGFLGPLILESHNATKLRNFPTN
jgi:hypothetical protein